MEESGKNRKYLPVVFKDGFKNSHINDIVGKYNKASV